MIRDHISDPLWSSSSNRNMSNRSLSEIKFLKEQAMKERHKKATAQATSQTLKRLDGMFNIEPRRPQDESFLSSTIKHVLGDYSTFANLIEGKETTQYLGLDNTVPGTPEVKDIDFENTNNGYIKTGKNGISSTIPIKKIIESKVEKNNHTFLEPAKTSGPENQILKSDVLKLKMPTKKDLESKTPNEVEIILKEMTQRLPPSLTEIQTPRSENEFFPFSSKVHTASNNPPTVEKSLYSTSNDDSITSIKKPNELEIYNASTKTYNQSKDKDQQDQTKSRKISMSSTSSSNDSNSESSSSSDSESDKEDTQHNASMDSKCSNFNSEKNSSYNNNYLSDKLSSTSIVPEINLTSNTQLNLNNTKQATFIDSNHDNIGPLDKRPLSIMQGTHSPSIENHMSFFNMEIEKTVSPLHENLFDELDFLNQSNLSYGESHVADESLSHTNNESSSNQAVFKSSKDTTNSLKSENSLQALDDYKLYEKVNSNKNYKQDSIQAFVNKSIESTKNDDARNVAGNKSNETKDKNKSKSTRIAEDFYVETHPEYAYTTNSQYTKASLDSTLLPNTDSNQNISKSPIDSMTSIVNSLTDEASWVPHMSPLHNSPVLSQMPELHTISSNTDMEINNMKTETVYVSEKNLYSVKETAIDKPIIERDINDNTQRLAEQSFQIVNDTKNELQNSINESTTDIRVEECKSDNVPPDFSQLQGPCFSPDKVVVLKNEETNKLICQDESDASSRKPKLKSDISYDTLSLNPDKSLIVKISLKKIKLKDKTLKSLKNNQKRQKSTAAEECVLVKTNDDLLDVEKFQSPCKRKLIDVKQISEIKYDDTDSCCSESSKEAFKLPNSLKFEELLVKINLSRLKRNPAIPKVELLFNKSVEQSDQTLFPNKDENALENEDDVLSDCSSTSNSLVKGSNEGLKKKRGRPPKDVKTELAFKHNKKSDSNLKRCSECGIINTDSGKDALKLSGYKVYRSFLNEGIMKKRKADNLKNPVERAHTYTDAVLNYVKYLIGCEIAGKLSTKQGIDELMRICGDCIRLVDYVVELYRRKANDSNNCDRRFLFLCFRLQSMLHMKLFKTRSDSIWRVRKVLTEYFKQYKPLSRITGPSSYQQPSEGFASTPLPSSPNFGPSPGGSVGSSGSAGSSSSVGSNDGKMSSGVSMVSIPFDMHEKNFQYLEFTKHLMEAHRLWSSAEILIPYCEDFIDDVTRKAGPLSLNSSLAQVVDYISTGLQVVIESSLSS